MKCKSEIPLVLLWIQSLWKTFGITWLNISMLKTQQFHCQIYSNRNAYACTPKDKYRNAQSIPIHNSLLLDYPLAIRWVNELKMWITVQQWEWIKLYPIMWVRLPNIKKDTRHKKIYTIPLQHSDFIKYTCLKTSKTNLWC